MNSTFRATGPSDAASISELLASAFGSAGDQSGSSREAMYWKYWTPHPFWEGSRSYVLESQGRILAHGAVVPQQAVWRTHRFRLFHLIDWAAASDVPGVGASLFLRVLRLADAGFVVGGSDMAQRILPALGFRGIGQATRYVRPLHPWRRLTGGRHKTLRLLAQFSRSVLWTLEAPSVSRLQWTAEPWSSGSAPDLPFPRPGEDRAIFERTAELFRFLEKSPLAMFNLFALPQDGGLRGYFLLAVVPGQVRIADCWLESSDSCEWRDLYLAAVSQAREYKQAAEIVTVAADDLRRQALEQAGFHPRGDDPIRFFTTRSSLRGVSALGYQMMDSDAAYLHLECELWS